MALSGKTTNFELKYPAVSDNIVMGPEADSNDFKEMMDSVDSILNRAAFKTVESGTDLNTLVSGLFRLVQPMTNDPSPTIGLRYLIATSSPPGNAQYYFADNGKIYYRFNAQSGLTITGEWKEISTEDITGKLADLSEGITDTNLVAAINSVKASIPDEVELDQSTLNRRGTYSVSGTDVTVTGITGTLKPGDLITIVSEANESSVIRPESTLVINGARYPIRWKGTTDSYDDTFGPSDSGYTFQIGTNYAVYISPAEKGDLIKIVKINGDSNLASVPGSGISIVDIENSTDSVDSVFDCSVMLLFETYGNTSNSQLGINQNGEIYYRVTDFSGSFEGVAWQNLIPKTKKYSSIVIGNSGSGLTADDVDYLYTSGSDFSTTLTNAINALPSTGGEIKILGGTYTLSTPVEASGTSARPIKITGEGKSTIITSATPTDHYMTTSHCEISECRLDTEIRIATKGYVSIHDCEIAERIYFNNSSAIQDIFIHDNSLDYTTPSKDFLYLSGSGGINNFQVYNNSCYGFYSFDFLHAAATKSICSSSIRNNHCPQGAWNSSTYDLDTDGAPYYRSTITGNTFSSINFSGSYWNISNNHITNNLNLYSGDYLNVMNNKVDYTFIAASGLQYANIAGNVIEAVATTSTYVNLGTNARFVNNVIRNTNFSTTYIPGYDDASNKWGNNMWADGIDRLVFANGEEIGGSPPVTYGVSIDLSNSNPETSVTYTDDAIGMTPGSNDWWNKPIFSKIKPCLFKEGKVVGYLNPNNFAEFEDGTTADITSGTAGDVMIEIPKIGYKISTDDDILTVKITNDMNKKSEGFCYYAHTRDTEGDRDNLYIGAFLGSLIDNKLRSLSGKTPINEDFSSFRTKANANGSGYDQLAFYPLTLLQCLYLIMYKNLDSQTALGKGYVSGSSPKTTGGTIINGMNYGTTSTSQQMKFLGIEDFWGNLCQWIDGLHSNSTRNILTAFKDFNDTGSGYIDRGQGATTDVDGSMKAPQGNNESAFVIKTAGGSATTYFADYACLSADRLPLFGFGFYGDDEAGAFSLEIYYNASFSSSDVGGRLMFL